MNSNFSSMSIKQQIIKFVKKEVQRGRYPTYDYICQKFRTNIRTHFNKGIAEIYKSANVTYIRDPNPFVLYKKEKLLTNIAIKFFKANGFKIESISIESNKHGPDILISDKFGNVIPVEIKAYQKMGRIGADRKYLRNEFEQIDKYVKKFDSTSGIIFTSTNRKECKTNPDNIKIIFEKEVREFLIKNSLRKEIKELNWILNSFASVSKEKNVKTIKESILKFVKSRNKKGVYTSKRLIEKKFRINVSSYFDSIDEIYDKLDIDKSKFAASRMGGNVDKEKMRADILAYIRSEIKNGRKPTYKEIQKKFRCLPKIFFPGGIREIYSELGLRHDIKFSTKTESEKQQIRDKVIQYIKSECKKGNMPKFDEIEEIFKIGIPNYFNGGVVEVYRLANVKLENRKGSA